MGEFETQARKYIETCADVKDRAYILALAVALDNAHARVELLVRSSRQLGEQVKRIADPIIGPIGDSPNRPQNT